MLLAAGTRSKRIEDELKTRERRHKHLVFVLNKVDLVPTWVTVQSFPLLSLCLSLTLSVSLCVCLSLPPLLFRFSPPFLFFAVRLAGSKFFRGSTPR